jgi:hypothetical protein
MRHWFIPHHYRQLGLQLFIGLLVYGAGLAWLAMTNRALRVEESSLKAASADGVGLAVSAPEEISQQDT